MTNKKVLQICSSGRGFQRQGAGVFWRQGLAGVFLTPRSHSNSLLQAAHAINWANQLLWNIRIAIILQLFNWFSWWKFCIPVICPWNGEIWHGYRMLAKRHTCLYDWPIEFLSLCACCTSPSYPALLLIDGYPKTTYTMWAPFHPLLPPDQMAVSSLLTYNFWYKISANYPPQKTESEVSSHTNSSLESWIIYLWLGFGVGLGAFRLRARDEFLGQIVTDFFRTHSVGP